MNESSTTKVHINKSMSVELSFLIIVLKDVNKYPLLTPIAHMVNRIQDFETIGDACLSAAGGLCDKVKFWWHLQFPLWVQQKTLRHYKILVKDKTTDQLITINVLEFLTEITNVAALIEHLGLHPDNIPHKYPILKN